MKLSDSTPGEALETFLPALGAKGDESLRAVTLPDHDFTWLLKGRPAPAEVLAQVKSRLQAKPMRRQKAGDPVPMPGGESGVIRPDDVREGRVVLGPAGPPRPFRIEMVGEPCKVFARPFIAARKAAEAKNRQIWTEIIRSTGRARPSRSHRSSSWKSLPVELCSRYLV